MKQKLLLTFALLLTAVTGAWADDSGSCGDGVTYSYVESTHTLTISKTGEGTGEMEDYYLGTQPWDSYLDQITTLVIGEGVTSIGDYAFYRCTNLASITIPASVTSIGGYAFWSCEGLESITLPASVTSIGNYAFYQCTNLASITIPSGVTAIGESAFAWCTSMESITIPASVTSIGEKAFGGCSKLATMTVAVGNTVYDSRNSCNAIIKTSSNTLIAGCKATTIPNDVTSIGNYAFWSCEGLESITLPASLKTIGKMAFYLCSKLESISIPDGVTSIGDEAFGYCSNLASINIPAKVTSIGADAFYGCSKLAAINVADGNNNYSSDASGVLFDKNKTTLIQYPLGKTAAAYEIPASVTSIGDMAFFNCDKLTSVTFAGTSVKTIGDNAFYLCTNLTSITIPASVTSIGDEAFSYCSNLASINIPAGVTSIGADLFSGCSKLASVTIPASVTTIGDGAFEGCALTSIEIPASVTTIGADAFYYCTNLGTITMNSSPLIGANAFEDIKSDAVVAINAPAHDANDYQWATFYNENYAFQADENTQVFKVALSGTTVELLEVTDKIVDAGTAVVLKSTGTPVMTLTTASSSDTQGNNLVGTYETITNPGNAYVLNNGDEGVGFYKLAATGTIGFGKAYLVASAAARDFLGFDETTGISEKIKVKSEKSGEGSDVIYDIHGRRVNGKPGKGLYIINGKKVVL